MINGYVLVYCRGITERARRRSARAALPSTELALAVEEERRACIAAGILERARFGPDLQRDVDGRSGASARSRPASPSPGATSSPARSSTAASRPASPWRWRTGYLGRRIEARASDKPGTLVVLPLAS